MALTCSVGSMVTTRGPHQGGGSGGNTWGAYGSEIFLCNTAGVTPDLLRVGDSGSVDTVGIVAAVNSSLLVLLGAAVNPTPAIGKNITATGFAGIYYVIDIYGSILADAGSNVNLYYCRSAAGGMQFIPENALTSIT